MSGQKLLIYGGTFDPPHIGHLNNLRAAMQAVRPDRVLVMPAGTPPHKLASETPADLSSAGGDAGSGTTDGSEEDTGDASGEDGGYDETGDESAG